MAKKLVLTDRDSCIGCGTCASVCPCGAITLDDENKPIIHESKCEFIGECVTSCPVSVLKIEE